MSTQEQLALALATAFDMPYVMPDELANFVRLLHTQGLAIVPLEPELEHLEAARDVWFEHDQAVKGGAPREARTTLLRRFHKVMLAASGDET